MIRKAQTGDLSRMMEIYQIARQFMDETGNPTQWGKNYPPEELIREYEQKTGHKVLCNKPYSGTQVLKDYGEQAMKENALIVYTSADSVFQVAANEELVPVHELYRYCEIAREMLKGVRRRACDRPPLPGQQRGYLLPHHQPPRSEPEAAPRHHAGSAEGCR